MLPWGVVIHMTRSLSIGVLFSNASSCIFLRRTAKMATPATIPAAPSTDRMYTPAPVVLSELDCVLAVWATSVDEPVVVADVVPVAASVVVAAVAVVDVVVVLLVLETDRAVAVDSPLPVAAEAESLALPPARRKPIPLGADELPAVESVPVAEALPAEEVALPALLESDEAEGVDVGVAVVGVGVAVVGVGVAVVGVGVAVVGVGVAVVGVGVELELPVEPLGQNVTVKSVEMEHEWVLVSSDGYWYASSQPSSRHVSVVQRSESVVLGAIDMATLKPTPPVTDLQSARLLQVPGYKERSCHGYYYARSRHSPPKPIAIRTPTEPVGMILMSYQALPLSPENSATNTKRHTWKELAITLSSARHTCRQWALTRGLRACSVAVAVGAGAGRDGARGGAGGRDGFRGRGVEEHHAGAASVLEGHREGVGAAERERQAERHGGEHAREHGG